MKAPEILYKAHHHMKDRAATYDKPEGERSMAQAVIVFNAFHGTSITEAQGWHFMQILKDVRLFSRAQYHADSAEDCIAYAALKAEAMAVNNSVDNTVDNFVNNPEPVNNTVDNSVHNNVDKYSLVPGQMIWVQCSETGIWYWRKFQCVTYLGMIQCEEPVPGSKNICRLWPNFSTSKTRPTVFLSTEDSPCK